MTARPLAAFDWQEMLRKADEQESKGYATTAAILRMTAEAERVRVSQ